MSLDPRASGASRSAVALAARRTRPVQRSGAGLLPVALSIACGLTLAGCAAPQDVPAPADHAPSTQKTARAAQHWDVLASRVAAQVADHLREWPPGEHPIHVALWPDESGFGRGFKQLLTTRLVERGLAVTTEPGPLRLQVTTQVVQHHAGAAPVSSGPWLADGVRADQAPALGLPPEVAGGALRTEILVTTSLEREQRVLVRTSDVMTIAQDDAALYQTRAQQPAAAAAPVMRLWRVVP